MKFLLKKTFLMALFLAVAAWLALGTPAQEALAHPESRKIADKSPSQPSSVAQKSTPKSSPPQTNQNSLSDRDFGLSEVANTSTSKFNSLDSALIAIINWLISLAGAIAFVVVVISGILYLTSYGNEEKAASAKKSLLGVALGSALVAGALFIVKLFITLIKAGRVS